MAESQGFTVEPKSANWHDPRAVADFTEGELIALRRDKLGWTQKDLAKAIGTSHSTILRVEKGTNKQRANYIAALAVIEKEEARRGASGPNLSIVGGRIKLSKESADAAAKIHATRVRFVRLQATLLQASTDVGQALADLDALETANTKRA